MTSPSVLNPAVIPDPVELNGIAPAIPRATDALSGLATAGCAIPDTRVVGTKTVACRTTDGGRERSQPCDNLSRHVAEPGSVIPIKLQLCDATGNNVSSSAVVLRAVDIIRVSSDAPAILADAGNANPDDDFRFDATLSGGGYSFNLSTKGVSTGTYRLRFAAAGDPVEHTVGF